MTRLRAVGRSARRSPDIRNGSGPDDRERVAAADEAPVRRRRRRALGIGEQQVHERRRGRGSTPSTANVKIAGELAATNAFSSHAKPVQVISAPTRLRRAARPGEEAGADPRRRRSPSRNATVRPRWSTWSDARDHGRAPSSPTEEGRERQHRQRAGERAQTSSSWTRSPESSAFGTNPRAPERLTRAGRSPRSRGSRRGSRPANPGGPVMRAATSKPSMSGSCTSSSTSWGLRRQVSATALAPSTASPMTLNPSDLEQHASARPKGRVVVDDQDGAVHRVRFSSPCEPVHIRLAVQHVNAGFLPGDGGRDGLDRCGGVLRAEHGGPGDEHRGARRGAARGRLGVDPAVDLEARRRRRSARGCAASLLERDVQERLAAPAGVDRHAQDHVGLELARRPPPACPG